MANESTPPFVDGLTLSRQFFEDEVQPILSSHFPRLGYAAALIGPGSEVLGFDTPISTDHHWGPRLMIFVSDDDLGNVGPEVICLLSRELPHTFMGYPTNFGPPDEIGVRLLQPLSSGPVSHRVDVISVESWCSDYLDWGPTEPPTVTQWLTFPQHRLRASTAGAVFHDERGELTTARATLSWYPHDIWLYLLAAQWNRIAEEEAFMARCGDVGDDLGSTLVAARQARELMHLCFLMEKQYPPYAKWFGRAFGDLTIAAGLQPDLQSAIRSPDWLDRETALSRAYERIATFHNSLSLTDPLETAVRNYHGRPYLVLDAGRFATALRQQIRDEVINRLPDRFGALNSVVGSTDLLETADLRRRLRRIYD